MFLHIIVFAAKILLWTSIFALLYTYFVYPAILILFVKFFKKTHHVDVSYHPSIGFLIPVYNEDRVIRKKIENILSLDYPSDRVSLWIGSDCSTDRTEEFVKSFVDSRVHLWVAPQRMGKTGIINHLVPQINAELVVFTDANTFHKKESLRKLSHHFADPEVGGVAGHVEHIGQSEEILEEATYRSFEAKQKLRESHLHSAISAFGGFYAIRKEFFHPLPKNAYSNDDVLIPMNLIRQKLRVIYDFEAVSVEDTTEAVQKEFQRRVRIGAGNFQAFFWLLDFLNPLKGWPFFCFVSHKVARWFSPLFLILWFMCCTTLIIFTKEILYSTMLVVLLIFFAAGLTYLILPFRWNRMLFYFLAMNMALAFGFFRYLVGINSAVWERTDRKVG